VYRFESDLGQNLKNSLIVAALRWGSKTAEEVNRHREKASRTSSAVSDCSGNNSS